MNNFLKIYPKTNIHLSAYYVHSTVLDAVWGFQDNTDKTECDVSNVWCKRQVFRSGEKSPMDCVAGEGFGEVSVLVLAR